MIEYKSELQRIISMKDLNDLESHLSPLTSSISEKNLASFFVENIYLKNVIQLIIEDFWIQSKNSEMPFDRFVKKFFNAELKPLLFLHSFFQNTNITELRYSLKAIEKTETLLLKCIKSKTYSFQKNLLQHALKHMSELIELEHQINLKRSQSSNDAKLSLYRAFDSLDQIFELEYILNEAPDIHQKERLYEGAGIGVQSSYATTLMALRYLNMTKGSRFIDLGSGYGRIGLVVGLMRPDIKFTGYEFVKERVDIANQSTTHLQMEEHVEFITQDLSDVNFKIPEAEIYYIFDSFTDASYSFIMDQLNVMTQSKKMVVVTKGNAKLWMNSKYWHEPQIFNDGNLCFFRSKNQISL